jgi:hypothetical protein
LTYYLISVFCLIEFLPYYFPTPESAGQGPESAGGGPESAGPQDSRVSENKEN